MRGPEISEVQNLADYMGFIFYPQSPRFVGENFTHVPLYARAQTVGVFVNESVDGIRNNLRNVGARWVQLHGTESEDDCMELKDDGITVIKAIAVGADFDPTTLHDWPEVSSAWIARAAHWDAASTTA